VLSDARAGWRRWSISQSRAAAGEVSSSRLTGALGITALDRDHATLQVDILHPEGPHLAEGRPA
jgi:hypothetical protein